MILLKQTKKKPQKMDISHKKIYVKTIRQNIFPPQKFLIFGPIRDQQPADGFKRILPPARRRL